MALHQGHITVGLAAVEVHNQLVARWAHAETRLVRWELVAMVAAAAMAVAAVAAAITAVAAEPLMVAVAVRHTRTPHLHLTSCIRRVLVLETALWSSPCCDPQ